ncbi:MAG: hypothetical protein AAFZ06_07770 [Pseudomonadota bacterium]
MRVKIATRENGERIYRFVFPTSFALLAFANVILPVIHDLYAVKALGLYKIVAYEDLFALWLAVVGAVLAINLYVLEYAHAFKQLAGWLIALNLLASGAIGGSFYLDDFAGAYDMGGTAFLTSPPEWPSAWERWRAILSQS